MKFTMTVVLATALLTTSVPAIVLPRGGGEGGDPPKNFTPIKPATTARVVPGPYKPPFATKHANAKASKRSEKGIICDEGGCFTVGVPRTFPPIPQPTKTASVGTQPYVPPFATKVKRVDDASVTDSVDAPATTEFIEKREEGGDPPKHFTPIKPVTTAHQGGPVRRTPGDALEAGATAHTQLSASNQGGKIRQSSVANSTTCTYTYTCNRTYILTVNSRHSITAHFLTVIPVITLIILFMRGRVLACLRYQNPFPPNAKPTNTVAKNTSRNCKGTRRRPTILDSPFIVVGYDRSSPLHSDITFENISPYYTTSKSKMPWRRGNENQFNEDHPFLVQGLEYVDVFDLNEEEGPEDRATRGIQRWRKMSPEAGNYSKNPNTQYPSNYTYCSQMRRDLERNCFPNVFDFARTINRYYGRVPSSIFKLIGEGGSSIIDRMLNDSLELDNSNEEITTTWRQLVDDTVQLLRVQHERFLQKPNIPQEQKDKAQRNLRKLQVSPCCLQSPIQAPGVNSVSRDESEISHLSDNEVFPVGAGSSLRENRSFVQREQLSDHSSVLRRSGRPQRFPPAPPHTFTAPDSVPEKSEPVEEPAFRVPENHRVFQMRQNEHSPLVSTAQNLKDVTEQLEGVPSAESLRQSLMELMGFASEDFLEEAERQRQKSIADLTAQIQVGLKILNRTCFQLLELRTRNTLSNSCHRLEKAGDNVKSSATVTVRSYSKNVHINLFSFEESSVETARKFNQNDIGSSTQFVPHHPHDFNIPADRGPSPDTHSSPSNSSDALHFCKTSISSSSIITNPTNPSSPQNPDPTTRLTYNSTTPIIHCEFQPCQRTFSLKYQYNRYMKSHTHPERCQLCDQGFETPKDLKRHHNSVHDT
ncbi:hypothetical protein HYFRA_00008648 [Hymenoscyphus fraxineus]|uniref:C2H2-type domain-containing protein n=1 Tax=Hymenoscyphus fraxineus TaxID=746836 RepID=A0A9N9KW46_9HELO|nr:hypothetical protein HYFRA_00008648 [Hymenoscyphus fraxineus]